MRWTKPPVISIHYLSTAIFLALKWSSNFSNIIWLAGLLRQNAGPHYPLGLGWGLIICISNKFTEDIDATGLEITLWEQCPLSHLLYLILPCFDGAHFPEERFVEYVYFTFHYRNFPIYAKIKNRIMNPTYHYSASTVIKS